MFYGTCFVVCVAATIVITWVAQQGNGSSLPKVRLAHFRNAVFSSSKLPLDVLKSRIPARA